jgi:hypothetical protein
MCSTDINYNMGGELSKVSHETEHNVNNGVNEHTLCVLEHIHSDFEIQFDKHCADSNVKCDNIFDRIAVLGTSVIRQWINLLTDRQLLFFTESIGSGVLDITTVCNILMNIAAKNKSVELLKCIVNNRRIHCDAKNVQVNLCWDEVIEWFVQCDNNDVFEIFINNRRTGDAARSSINLITDERRKCVTFSNIHKLFAIQDNPLEFINDNMYELIQFLIGKRYTNTASNVLNYFKKLNCSFTSLSKCAKFIILFDKPTKTNTDSIRAIAKEQYNSMLEQTKWLFQKHLKVCECKTNDIDTFINRLNIVEVDIDRPTDGITFLHTNPHYYGLYDTSVEIDHEDEESNSVITALLGEFPCGVEVFDDDELYGQLLPAFKRMQENNPHIDMSKHNDMFNGIRSIKTLYQERLDLINSVL